MSDSSSPDQHTSVPACVGIIMDGNRRWAKERNLPPLEGHRAGYEKLKEVTKWCTNLGVRHLVVYAFSTENWKRSSDEVGYLMDLMRTLLRDQLAESPHPDEAIHIVGDHTRFPDDIQKSIIELHNRNTPYAKRHLWVCASYGGRQEVLAAIHTLPPHTAAVVTEEEFTQALWTGSMPEPDIIIRTGGEKRLSNFLLWHAGYSELFFLDTFWPDFSKEEFDAVCTEFAHRTRKYGV